jgi:hypothetical protein
MSSDWPGGLTAEGIDQAERVLVQLLPEQDVALLHPVPRERHAAIVMEIEQLPWPNDPRRAAEQAHEALLAGVDPADDEGDVPWALALSKLGNSPGTGTRLARSWFVALQRLRWEGGAVSVVMEGVACYAVAVFELLLGREHEVRRWTDTAAMQTDYEEERRLLGLVVLVRSVRLLDPVLRQWGRCP